MKKGISLLIICLVSLQLSAQVNLSFPQNITTADFGNNEPKIGMVNAENPIAFWSDNTHLYVATSINGSFNEPQELDVNGTTPFTYSQEGPSMHVIGNNIYIVYFDNSTDDIYLIASYNGGENFNLPIKLPQKGFLPMVKADYLGNPIIAYIDTQDRLAFTRSNDLGQNFQTPVIASELSNGATICECCQMDLIAPTPTDVYISFRNNDNNQRDIWLVKSTDGGETFTNALDIDNTDWMISACPASGPDVLLTGNTLISTFYSAAQSPAKVFATSINTETMEVDNQVTLNNAGEEIQNLPKIAGEGDNIAIVWEENLLGKSDIMMAWSNTGFSGLKSNFINISSTANGSERYPDITYANGQFHIIYSDLENGLLKYQTAVLPPPINTNINAINESVKVSTSNGFIRVNAERFVQIHLFNINGQLVESTAKTQINIQNLPSGIYIIQVETTNGSVSKRLVF